MWLCIPDEESPQVAVTEAVRDTLSDLVPTKPLYVLPADFKRGHYVLGALHDIFLTKRVPVAHRTRLQLDVEPRHVPFSWNDQD